MANVADMKYLGTRQQKFPVIHTYMWISSQKTRDWEKAPTLKLEKGCQKFMRNQGHRATGRKVSS